MIQLFLEFIILFLIILWFISVGEALWKYISGKKKED